MKELYQLFKEYIYKYKNTNDEKEKQLCAKSIVEIYFATKDLTRINMDDYKKEYKKLLYNDLDFYDLIENFFDKEKETKLFNDEEFNYIKSLLKYIDTNINVEQRISRSFNTVINYIGNKKYKDLTKNLEVFIDDKIIESTYFSVYDKGIIFLENDNLVFFIHELVHSLYDSNKYLEFPSILGELSYCANYKLGDSLDRLEDIDNIKDIKYKKYNKNIEYINNYLQYGVGVLLSIPFIYKNGTSFDNVLKIIKMINDNPEDNIFSLLNKININDKDIIESFKSYKKILSRK